MTFGSPASSGLFIINPYPLGFFTRLFSTHPPIRERVRRLRLLAQAGSSVPAIAAA